VIYTFEAYKSSIVNMSEPFEAYKMTKHIVVETFEAYKSSIVNMFRTFEAYKMAKHIVVENFEAYKSNFIQTYNFITNALGGKIISQLYRNLSELDVFLFATADRDFIRCQSCVIRFKMQTIEIKVL